MASIKLENISKSFGRTRVIHDITLDIKDGELIVFVGPSGCGKSTLLRMISGLEEQSGGDIHIGERLVNTVPPQDRRVAMVFQNYALYPHMTVEQNISFRLRLKKVPKPDRDKAVAEAARILGLEDLLHRKPRELSGGQRQRVAMGRAIVRNPDVFLMDEPLSNLDAKLRNHMRVEIKQLQRRLGTTTVYVTHDQVEAMTMADRIVILDQGRVAQFATPDQVYYQPENIFVADFIGAPAMNFIPAKRTSQTELTLEGGLTMPLSGARQEISEEKLTVGIRPEHVAIAPGGESLAPETMIVALFEQVADFGWANTYAALIVPFLASATGTFLFRQHFLQIPTSLLDAARIDGAGPLRFAWHIVLPMSANVIAALAVIEFVYMWNQYLWPLIVIQESSYQVVQVGLRMMTAGQDATNWGIVMAGAIVSLIPALIVFMLLQEQFSRGFALSQEK